MLIQSPYSSSGQLMLLPTDSINSNCLWQISFFSKSSFSPTRISKLWTRYSVKYNPWYLRCIYANWCCCFFLCHIWDRTGPVLWTCDYCPGSFELFLRKVNKFQRLKTHALMLCIVCVFFCLPRGKKVDSGNCFLCSGAQNITMIYSLGPLNWHGFTLIPAWIGNTISCCTNHTITYPCWDYS